jgi:hypothetical protein
VSAGALPELARVAWRAPMDEARLRRMGRLWTLTTVAHSVPFVLTAVALLAIAPVLAPMAAIALVFAWVIPALHAQRGANVLKSRRRADAAAERAAAGLLGDLVGHAARDLHARTGLVVEPGGLGTWVIGEVGAVLVRRRRVHCFCVRVDEPDLPSADRVAHLLLALRSDETGFATVANGAFSGASWRLSRRLPRAGRVALAAARAG